MAISTLPTFAVASGRRPAVWDCSGSAARAVFDCGIRISLHWLRLYRRGGLYGQRHDGQGLSPTACLQSAWRGKSGRSFTGIARASPLVILTRNLLAAVGS